MKHIYEVRPRKDKRGFDLISDVLPFGRLWYPVNFPMRYKLLCLVLLEMLVVSAPTLCATDLRGGVVGVAGPLVGVGVALFEVKPNKTFRLVRQTVTAPDGRYHFNKVHPGQYVLRIGGINYPLEVRETQMQDIPVIAKPRH